MFNALAGKAGQDLDPKNHLFERDPLDLRHRIHPEMILVAVLSVQVETHPWTDATGSTLPLLSVGLGHPDGVEALHVLVWGEPSFLHLTNLDHVDTVLYGDTRLSDVSRDHNLALSSTGFTEHLRLLLAGQGRVEGDQLKVLAPQPPRRNQIKVDIETERQNLVV